VEAGQSPSQFWDLTLREVVVVLRGAGERSRKAHNDRAWLAWHIAHLPKLKRLPKLASLMIGRVRARRTRRQQTVSEQIAVARQWPDRVRE
jgi:hypothetical protein